MSAFSDSALIKKLVDLNSSQQSIQTLSLWLIHHRKRYSLIVRTWFSELRKATDAKRLTLMYLANDVIQNSKRKGPEYGKEFASVLLNVFAFIGRHTTDQRLLRSLERILQIWEERGVYAVEVIAEWRNCLMKIDVPVTHSNKRRKSDDKEKRKASNATKSETMKVNGTVETHVTLNPHVSRRDPPESSTLILALTELETSASSDAEVREKIANVPPEITEVRSILKLKDKGAAAVFREQVDETIGLLKNYNGRLAKEMESRKRVAKMLKDYELEQNDLCEQAEERLEEFKSKLLRVKEVQKELKEHLSNFPDLPSMPDPTNAGLAPLPSAGDLFNNN